MVVAIAVVPTLLLFAVGHVKHNLFDIRYLSSAVMAALLLTARMVTGTSRSLRLQAAACVALVAILGASLFDEQVNGSNPRRYDFRSALTQVHAELRPGDRLLYDPADLDLVVGYYAGAEAPHPFSPASATVPAGGRLFILASKPLMNAAEPAVLGRTLSRLDRADRLVEVIRKSNVAVWVYDAPTSSRALP